MRNLFFIITCLSYFLYSSASPMLGLYNNFYGHAEQGVSSKTFQSSEKIYNPPGIKKHTIAHSLYNKDSPQNIVPPIEPQIYGYKCRDISYPIFYLRKVATFGAYKLNIPSFQQYPIEIESERYIYPLHQSHITIWKQGDPEGQDRVIFDKNGKVVNAVTLSYHPGLDIKSSYERCGKIFKSLPHPSRRFSVMELSSPNSHTNPTNLFSTSHGAKTHIGTVSMNTPCLSREDHSCH